MGSRTSESEFYRYGFQKQEKDDEFKGKGNSLNFEFRMYDSRVGRFFALDPLTSKYPFYSTYSFSGNKVVDCGELEGLEPTDILKYLEQLVKSYIVQVTKKYLEKALYEIASGTLNYVESIPDNLMANELIVSAKQRTPDAEELNESQKEKYFRNDARKTQGILLYEFATGTGKSERTFSFPDPIVKEIASGYVLEEILDEFQNHIESRNLTVDEWAAKGESFEDDIPFSPDHTGLPNSIYRHIASNSSQFVIGGSVYTITPTSIHNVINVSIENKMSRNSLTLHQLGKNAHTDHLKTV